MLIIDSHIILYGFLRGSRVLSWLSELGSPVLKDSAMKKYNQSRMYLYKKVINKCCNPKCDGILSPLQTHHIEPLRHSGIDEFLNYIVLCRGCHSVLRRHKDKKGWNQEVLLKWKFQAEIIIVGYASDDFEVHEYRKLLREALREKNRYI